MPNRYFLLNIRIYIPIVTYSQDIVKDKLFICIDIGANAQIGYVYVSNSTRLNVLDSYKIYVD